MEQKIIDAVKACTKKEIEITLNTNLKEDLGFDSFDTLMLMSELEGELNTNLDESKLAGIETIADIVERIKQYKGETAC